MQRQENRRNVAQSNFRLSRYFSITCLVGVCVVLAGLSLFNRQLAFSALIQHETRADVDLAQAMANTIWPRYASFVQRASLIPGDELRDRPEIAQLHRDMLEQMKGLNVVKVKIYNLDGLTVFSTDPTQIGDDKSKNPGFLSAKAGKVKAELTFREQFSAFEEVIVDRNVLSPYIPIRRNESSPVEGVFEIYSDVTELVDNLHKTQWQIVGGVLLSLVVLYFFLFMMVRRADGIIKAQERDLRDNLEWLDQANSQVSSANNQLEARVDQRTAELRIAMEEAQAASIAKSQFLATMSHEIRTPINGVLGNTELLLDGDLSDKQRSTTEIIFQSGKALLSVINDILDFSRVEAGKVELQSSVFGIRLLIEDIGKHFAEAAHKKGLELICDIPASVPSNVRGDAGRVRQILNNLISNAIKFTDAGEVVVRIAPVAELEDSETLRIEVTDSGSGISPAMQEIIFESFSQVDGSMARQYGGSGLGLAISKQLVELMDGEIGVDSTPGKGSTFWFTMSLPKELADVSGETDEITVLQGVRVLIVDDNKTNREILRQQLDIWEVEHESAERGAEALEILRTAAIHDAPFDVVILDKQIPGMDGPALIQLIRADSAISSVPVIMLSSVFDTCDTRVGDKSPILSCLTKPVRQSDLFNCLVSALSQSRVAKASGPTDSPTGAQADLNSEGRILVVDDNPINSGLARDILSRWGCQVDVVADGRSAVNRVSKNTYSLVLMDCQMPEMDGFEATREIRRQEEAASSGSRVPIVAMTANAMKGDRERCLDSGMDDYLSKPFSQRDLHNIVVRWSGHEDDNSGAAIGETVDVQARSDAGSSTLDQQSLDEIRSLKHGDGPDPLVKYIEIFLRNSPELLETMRMAVKDIDSTSLAGSAHSLKADSASLGARKLAEYSRLLEEMGRTQRMADAPDVLLVLESEYEEVCQALLVERDKAA